MDYKRRLSLSSSPEAQGLINALKLQSYDRRLRKIAFRYLLRIKLLPTFSYISVVVSVSLGRFSQNRSHMYYASTHQNILALQTSHNSSFIMLYESISCMFLQYSVKIFIFSTASNTFQCASFLFLQIGIAGHQMRSYFEKKWVELNKSS